MKIYLLNLSILPTEEIYDDDYVVVNQWHYSDVFTSDKKAVAFGKKMLIDRFKKIKPAYKKESMHDFVVDEVRYRFYIFEFDPDVERYGRDGRGGHKWEEFIWWEYDYKGNVINRTLWDNECGYFVLPGDYNEDAGTRFASGTFVTIEHNDEYYHSEKELNTIYVVFAAPGRRNEFCLGADTWENIYLLGCIDNSGYYSHNHAHEARIHLYNGTVPDDHPLQILRKYAIGELDISNNLWHDITERKILLDYPKEYKSWRDIPELTAAMKSRRCGK